MSLDKDFVDSTIWDLADLNQEALGIVCKAMDTNNNITDVEGEFLHFIGYIKPHGEINKEMIAVAEAAITYTDGIYMVDKAPYRKCFVNDLEISNSEMAIRK